jgi:hypothetical protein
MGDSIDVRHKPEHHEHYPEPTKGHDVETQKKLIALHLNRFGHITSEEAIRLYGITRVAAIIPILRKRGMDIKPHLEYDHNNKSRHWSVYELDTVTKY